MNERNVLAARTWPVRRLAALPLIAVALGACSGLRTPEVDPALDVPGHWQHAPRQDTAGAPGTAPGPQAWWEAFGDPQLSALVAAALAANNDLAITALRFERARLHAGLAATNRAPELDAQARGTRQWNLDGPGRRPPFGGLRQRVAALPCRCAGGVGAGRRRCG